MRKSEQHRMRGRKFAGPGKGLFAIVLLQAGLANAELRIRQETTYIANVREVQSLDVAGNANDIHVLVVGKPKGADHPVLLYTGTRNLGRSWRKPTIIDATPDLIVSRRGNDAQLAIRNRNMVAVWQRRGAAPGSEVMALAYSHDGGRSWTHARPPRFDDPTQRQGYMDLVADRKGRFHMVWLDDREENGNSEGLRHAVTTDGGHHWREMAAVDPTVCTCCWNRLLLLSDNSVAVLYRDDTPHDMKLKRLAPDGDWQELGAVGRFNWEFVGCPHCGGGLTAALDRKASFLHSVVWTGKENTAGSYYLRSTDNGNSWSEPLRIAGERSKEADIGADGTRLGIVYIDSIGESSAVYYRSSDDNGKNWTNPQRISEQNALADHPRILAGLAGQMAVFWTERRAGQGRVLAMALINDSGI